MYNLYKYKKLYKIMLSQMMMMKEKEGHYEGGMVYQLAVFRFFVSNFIVQSSWLLSPSVELSLDDCLA